MSYAAFDKQEFVATLERSGVPTEQTRAISSAVRKAHETADVATKAGIERMEAKIEKLALQLTVRLSAIMVGVVGLASTIVTFVVKLF